MHAWLLICFIIPAWRRSVIRSSTYLASAGLMYHIKRPTARIAENHHTWRVLNECAKILLKFPDLSACISWQMQCAASESLSVSKFFTMKSVVSAAVANSGVHFGSHCLTTRNATWENRPGLPQGWSCANDFCEFLCRPTYFPLSVSGML